MNEPGKVDAPGKSLPWRTVTLATALLALIVQGYVSFEIRPEPYPIIRMPSFGLAASADGTYEVTFVSAVALFEDGTTESIDPSAIMEPFRFSTARPSWDYMFGPRATTEPSPELIDWVSARVESIAGREAVELSMCWSAADVTLDDASRTNEEPCEWKVLGL